MKDESDIKDEISSEKSEKKKNDNNIINPIGLVNVIFEKKDYFGYNYNYKMTIGNICYMNSSIQCLLHLKDFTDKIIKASEDKNGALITATAELIKQMKGVDKKKSNVLSVEDIKKSMGKIDDRYNDYNQEDANEFISNYLDGLLNEIGDKNKLPIPLNINDKSDEEAYIKFYNRFYNSKGDSFLLDLFYSILKTQKVCKSCNRVISIKFNAYNLFELPIYELAKIRKDLDFIEIFNNYLAKNHNIDGECKYCGQNNIYEQIFIYSLSKYLIFYFGRTIGNKYVNNQIIYPDEYNFSRFLRISSNNNCIYKITSVIYYSRLSKKSGHYTASCLCGNSWYHFNDDIVTKEENNENEYEKPIILIYENNIEKEKFN
jgi:ubiquitin C-terminal hydrolase